MSMGEKDISLEDLNKYELELRAQEQLALAKEEFRGNFKRLGLTTLIIGGIFLLTFFIRKKFVKKKYSDHGSLSNPIVVKNPKNHSIIVTKIKEHIAIFLLSILKERLFDYMVKKTDSKK
jgi:hypothetical protein